MSCWDGWGNRWIQGLDVEPSGVIGKVFGCRGSDVSSGDPVLANMPLFLK